MNLDFNADPDPDYTSRSNTDPNPASKNNADQDPFFYHYCYEWKQSQFITITMSHRFDVFLALNARKFAI